MDFISIRQGYVPLKVVPYIFFVAVVLSITTTNTFVQFLKTYIVMKVSQQGYGLTFLMGYGLIAMKGSRVETVEAARKEYKELLEQGWKKTSIFNSYFQLQRAMHHAKLCKVLQMIAQRSPREYLRIVRSQSGRQDSNLRPSAPKAPEQTSL